VRSYAKIAEQDPTILSEEDVGGYKALRSLSAGRRACDGVVPRTFDVAMDDALFVEIAEADEYLAHN
jgi:hypothetical protein